MCSELALAIDKRRKVKTILVVDDDERVVATLMTFFSKNGYRVGTAFNGKAGLKAARKVNPDLILLDIEMPQLNGLQVLKRLNADKRTRYTPTIMLTGVDTPEAKDEATYEYAERYVTKPVELNLLKTEVESVLSLR